MSTALFVVVAVTPTSSVELRFGLITATELLALSL
eukprot:CAMPEP_0206469728 /NCGR_PEP_ID=MMETSP0324_2-20121206/30466_1 /ASSEMBLY_ACC=CAM_ASM_000836 /TAXON_ID=2866 /ORGANISM="Crypthecodinium cohnii, Strain Seligo" /LENGTH=34 /DNA_ID= /DNA_START= /DNA_END= /DNA_ORIENTATION=